MASLVLLKSATQTICIIASQKQLYMTKKIINILMIISMTTRLHNQVFHSASFQWCNEGPCLPSMSWASPGSYCAWPECSVPCLWFTMQVWQHPNWTIQCLTRQIQWSISIHLDTLELSGCGHVPRLTTTLGASGAPASLFPEAMQNQLGNCLSPGQLSLDWLAERSDLYGSF